MILQGKISELPKTTGVLKPNIITGKVSELPTTFNKWNEYLMQKYDSR